MRKLSVAAVAGTLALVGLAPNAFGQPPEGVPPTERPPAAPPGCAIALEMTADTPGAAAVAERCGG